MVPRVLGLSMNQITMVVNTLIASFLATCLGVATAYPFVQLFGAGGVVAVSGLVATTQVGVLLFVWRRMLVKRRKIGS